jgi:hypothetical protein
MGVLKTIKHQATKLFYITAYLTLIVSGKAVNQIKYYGEVYLMIGCLIATGFIVQLPEDSRSGAGWALFIITNLLAIPYAFAEGSILNSHVRGLQGTR